MVACYGGQPPSKSKTLIETRIQAMDTKQFEDLTEFHKTNDMALITYLKLRGHATQGVQFVGGTCYWYFRNTEGLADMIDEFASGDALVEPREYNRTFTQTKREMYDEKDRQGI